MGGCSEVRFGQGRLDQAEVRLDAVHAGAGQCLVEALEGVGAVRAVGDDLREHRVVRRRHLGAGLHPAVDAYAVRELDPGQQARAGPVFTGRVLGVDAGLDGVAARGAGVADDVGLALGQP